MEIDKILKIIQITLIIIAISIFILLFVGLNTGESNADKWRRSKTGLCLKEIAEDFCLERNMEFKKIYSPLYRTLWKNEDFICNERGNLNTYAFSSDEEIKCGDEFAGKIQLCNECKEQPKKCAKAHKKWHKSKDYKKYCEEVKENNQ